MEGLGVGQTFGTCAKRERHAISPAFRARALAAPARRTTHACSWQASYCTTTLARIRRITWELFIRRRDYATHFPPPYHHPELNAARAACLGLPHLAPARRLLYHHSVTYSDVSATYGTGGGRRNGAYFVILAVASRPPVSSVQPHLPLSAPSRTTTLTRGDVPARTTTDN